jgi:tRNA(fMet)-specific endonuclease VapC
MIRYLLDTTIAQEPLKVAPDPYVLQHLEQHRAEWAISATVWHELWFGCRRLPPSRRRTTVEAYLNELVPNYPILPYDIVAADWHARERSRLVALGRTPPFANGQIAAVAAVNGIVLVTRNVADFTPFQGLMIENWFEPTP